MTKLTDRERVEVEHWRTWCKAGGKSLVYAPQALEPLIEIIDRLIGSPVSRPNGETL
jgi:hypothetical protein